jgi:signal transduction histidine kinase/ligand-binding sensor domain-containing protein
MHVLVFLLTCAPLLCTPCASALDPNKHLTQYIHTAWRTQDGSAPAADMISITQTSDGFLWFVSSRGLYRFDGARFVPWTLPAGVLGTRIANILGDRAGGLWIVMRDEILHLKGGVVISRFELSGVQSTQNLSEDSDGTLWLVRGALNSSENPLCHVSDQALKCFGKEDGIPISPINSLLSDGKGGFWLGGFNALVHWHGGVSESYPTKGQVVSLVPNADGSLMVGMLGEGQGKGLARWKNGSVSAFVTPPFNESKVAVTRIMSDRTGNVWVGTEGEGVFRIHGTAVEHYGHTEGLSSDTVWTLFEDRDGIVWAATPNGLDSFRDPAVTIFSSLEGLTKDAAAGILATKDGAVWVANDGSLDRIANETVSSIRTGAGLPGHQVTSMLEDRAGNLWVGVDDSLYLYDNGRFRRLPSPDKQPLGMIVGITEDVAGNIWAECLGKTRRLVRIRDFRVQEQFTESQVPAGHSLAADPKGGIWIGTLKGEIALFRNGILEKRYPLNLTGESAADLILPRADGSVLAGSTDGLFGLHDGKPQRIGKKNGLPCNWTYSFIEDRNKNWWLSTECGIVELSDSEFQRWWANPETIVQARFYDTSDGARPSPPSFNSAAYSSDGRVWFATGVVVQIVDPSRLKHGLPPVQAYIESVIVDRKELTAIHNLEIPPRPRDLQIDYTSPTTAAPQRVKFRYQLENYDRDWHDAGTRRQAFYTDLPPGKYTFRVIASNSDGVWNDSGAKLDFTIAPAYYQTNWFRAVCAAAFLALLWALYQLRLRQMTREFQMTLDTRVAERTRIARDLHDTLLQSFHGLLLHFQTGINLLPGRPDDARKALEKALHQAKHAIIEGREAVQGLRSSVLEKNDLALAIRTLGEELAVNSNSTAFQVNVEGTARDLHPIVRDEIYRITGEAMRNAFRHAEATQIEVEIHYDERRLRVRVRDDGKGVDEKLLGDGGREGHFGLRGMRERATLIGGKLTVWSELSAGTEVELSVPAAGAYTSTVDGQPMSVTKKVLARISGRGIMKKS